MVSARNCKQASRGDNQVTAVTDMAADHEDLPPYFSEAYRPKSNVLPSAPQRVEAVGAGEAPVVVIEVTARAAAVHQLAFLEEGVEL